MSEDNNIVIFNQTQKVLIKYAEDAKNYAEKLAQDPDFKIYIGKTAEDISYACTIIKDNIFPITLFAKFQSGKSTTTAAMSDGREITPCGKGGGGLRTSTVPVTIYNSDNVPLVEYEGKLTTPVEIKILSKVDLTKTIADAASTLPVPVGDDGEPIPKEYFYDLDNAKHKKILEEAIKAEIEIYKNDAFYDNNKLTTLQDAILIIKFYGCDAYKKLCAGEFSTIQGMQPFLKVENWETKWANLREAGLDLIDRKNTALDFKAEECLHVFIESIRVPVPSKFMAETGTAVTDSPGIMANSRDTERARKAAVNAAVILFVLNGDTQFSDEDKAQLQFLKANGMAKKVIFAMNFKRNPNVIRINGIERSIAASLKSLGYTEPYQQEFLYFNAYLAMHYFQAPKVLSGEIDTLSEQGIIADAKQFFPNKNFSNAKDALKKTTVRVLRMIDEEDCADDLQEVGFTQSVLQKIYQISGWAPMITKLRSHIIQKRAASVLRDLGINPTLKAITAIEKTLKSREAAAEFDKEKATEEYEKAKFLLEKFSDQANQVIDENLTDYIDKSLAENYYSEVVIAAVDDSTKKAAPQIYDETGLLSNIGSAVGWAATKAANFSIGFINFFTTNEIDYFEHTSIGETCNNIMSREYELALSNRGTAWTANLESSPLYTGQVKNTVLFVQQQFKNLWQELKLKENPFLEKIEPLPAELTGSMSKDVVRRDINRVVFENDTYAAGDSIADMINALLAGVATYASSAFVYLHVLPATFIIPGIGQILLLVAAGVALIKWLTTDDQERINQLQQKIATELKNKLAETKEDTLSNIINGQPEAFPEPKPGVNFIRNFYTSFFKGVLEQQKKTLEAEYKQKLAEFNQTQAKRDEIKAKAAQWRQQHIQPLRQNLQELQQQIENVWGAGDSNA